MDHLDGGTSGQQLDQPLLEVLESVAVLGEDDDLASLARLVVHLGTREEVGECLPLRVDLGRANGRGLGDKTFKDEDLGLEFLDRSSSGRDRRRFVLIGLEVGEAELVGVLGLQAQAGGERIAEATICGAHPCRFGLQTIVAPGE